MTPGGRQPRTFEAGAGPRTAGRSPARPQPRSPARGQNRGGPEGRTPAKRHIRARRREGARASRTEGARRHEAAGPGNRRETGARPPEAGPAARAHKREAANTDKGRASHQLCAPQARTSPPHRTINPLMGEPMGARNNESRAGNGGNERNHCAKTLLLRNRSFCAAAARRVAEEQGKQAGASCRPAQRFALRIFEQKYSF